MKEHNRAILTAAATLRKSTANNQAGRATLATTATHELEELNVSHVMMSYDLPQEPEQTVPDEQSEDAVLFQMVIEHRSEEGPGHNGDNIQSSSAPKQTKGPPSVSHLPEKELLYSTVPNSDAEYDTDRSPLSTYTQGGGTIPADADQCNTLLTVLRSVPSIRRPKNSSPSDSGVLGVDDFCILADLLSATTPHLTAPTMEDGPRHTTELGVHAMGKNNLTINPNPTGVYTRGVIPTRQ